MIRKIRENPLVIILFAVIFFFGCQGLYLILINAPLWVLWFEFGIGFVVGLIYLYLKENEA